MTYNQSLEFWFDFGSTYSYPAAFMLTDVSIPVRHRPFLLGPTFKAQGWNDSPFNLYPAKGRYMWRDMERLCEEAGLVWRRPSVFPRNGLLASRIAIAGGLQTWVPAFCRRVFELNFAEDRDISDRELLRRALDDVDGNTELSAAMDDPDIKEKLRAQTARSSDMGIFGAPTFSVGEELFWGTDRLAAALRRVGYDASATIEGTS